MTTDSDAENGMPPVNISNWPFIINLSNSIIGIAILALPFCFKECGLILGLGLLLGSAWITDVTCHLLMKASSVTKRRSYEYLALHMFGIAGKFTIEISIIGLLIGTCIAFYIIIGDIGPVIVSNLTGLENTNSLRTLLLVTVTLFGILPLGLMQNLDSLSRFSAVSLSFYCCFAFHVILSAFTNFFSGVWIRKVVYWNPEGLFKCLPIFALSYSCQTQLFILNEALPEPSVKRMSDITRRAVYLVSCLYVVVGCFGYIAFYDDEITGDVLMNFQPTLFSDLIKLGFVISTIISFPLVIFPCRASIYTLLFAQQRIDTTEEPQNVNKTFDSSIVIPSSYFKAITFAIVFFTLCVGIAVPNVEFMLAITGATMGSLICYVFPAVMSMTIASLGHGKQKIVSQFVLFVGIAILLASTYTTLSTQEKFAQQESVVKVAQPIEHKDHVMELPLVVDEPRLDRRQEPPIPREPLEQPVLFDKPDIPAAPFDAEAGVVDQADKKGLVNDPVKKIDRKALNEKKPEIEPANQRKTVEKRKLPNESTPKKVNTEPEVTENPQITNKINALPQTSSDIPIKPAEERLQKKADDKQAAVANGNGNLAEKILDELKKQREEHKQLLIEQRQIVDELKQHQMEIHRIDDKHWHEDTQHNETDQRSL